MIRTRRPGFTLIELLIVISIIAVLASLLLAGVMNVISRRVVMQNQNDISQLSIALQNFKTKFGVWPPDQIMLHDSYADYDMTNPAELASLAYLLKIWPKLNSKNFSGATWNGTSPLGKAGVTLRGDQCLIFFLGGPAAGGLPQGFCTDPQAPWTPIKKQLEDRLGPYYTPDSARLVDLTSGKGFYSLIDNYNQQQPYLYFSSGLRPNGYDKTHTITIASRDNVPITVSPYFKNASGLTQYWNPDSYQIICAGADGAFGIGGLWTPANAGAYDPAGKDDLSNFYHTLLGVGQ